MTQKERDLDMIHKGQQEEKGLSNEEIEDLQKSILLK